MLSSIKSTDDGVPQGFVHWAIGISYLCKRYIKYYVRLFLDEKSL